MKTFYVGVKGIVRVGDACLVLHKDDAGEYWDFPGGRMDADESIEETLRRELAEEIPSIGSYSIGSVLGAYRLPKSLPDGESLVLLFTRIDAEPFEVQLSSEHSGYRFVTKEELPSLKESGRRIEPGHYKALEDALA